MILEGRILAIDYGTKTIGIALSDSTRTIAQPLCAVPKKNFPSFLTQAIAEHNVRVVLLGYPVNMNGTKGPACDRVQSFAQTIKEHCAIEPLLWDERMSTMAVTKAMLEADLSRQKRAKRVDALAACYILQGYLDYVRRQQYCSDI